MRYREYLPSPAYADIVERYWFLTGPAAAAWEAVLPDGRAELIFHFGTPFAQRASGRTVIQPRTIFAGQLTAPVRLLPRGEIGVAAIRLRPAAVGVLGVHARDVTDRLEDLASMTDTSLLVERLAEARCSRTRVRILENWLAPRIRTAPRPDVVRAVSTLVRHDGMVAIEGLQHASGMTRRHLERLFHAHVGIAPKTFARLLRLKRAAVLLLANRPLVDVAGACGYSDQAHMSNDFRALVDRTPGAWQQDAGALAPLLVAP